LPFHLDDQIVVAQFYTVEQNRFISYKRTMKKFKLVKDKWYFQSLRETKSVKETEDWAVEISWYASTKDKDRWWDVVEPKAFQSALERYMTNPIVLLQHKMDKPIGIVEEANIDDNWLFIKAKISQNTDWVMDLIKNGVLRAFSIWYSVKDYDTDVRELADWTYDMTNIIKDLELYEISVVSVPMNPYALSKSIEDLLEVEEHEEESEEEVVEEESEEKEEETSVQTVAESEQTEEAVEEWADVQEEEKSEEIESEEIEETEERPNEEVEAKEICEEADDKKEWVVETINSEEVEEVETKVDDSLMEEDTIKEINEINWADENSEISDEAEVEESSENDSETESNDVEVVEKHDEEIVETKSMEVESQKWFDFESKIAQLTKSFDDKLAMKDEQIKSLESKVEQMTKLFAESLETIDRMATAVKNTPVNSGLQYKRPLKKWWYFDIASIIKSL